MEWPFAFAVVGISGALTITIMAARISYNERLRQIAKNETDLEQARIAVSVKNGAVPALRE